MQYTHSLVRELMTQYGRIDILWYDLPQCYSAAEWRSVELNSMVRQLQPHIIINNRAMTTEDFATAEGHVSASSAGRMWEACLTLNNHWGYCPSDTDYKSPRHVLLALANAAQGAGNLLLNVGPDGHGAIPPESAAVLGPVGRWLERNGESIYGSQRPSLRYNYWGPTTRRGNTIYLHLESYYGGHLVVSCLKNRILRASLLGTGRTLKVKRDGDRQVLSGLPAKSPDPILSVVKLELDSPPAQDFSQVIGTADVFPNFP